jgi:hypothetical protein
MKKRADAILTKLWIPLTTSPLLQPLLSQQYDHGAIINYLKNLFNTGFFFNENIILQ